jgi:ABC-type multidrug transport system fused ATPase/permease subunit
MSRVRARLDLLRLLAGAGPGLLTVLLLLTAATAVIPAATAVAVGQLIDRLAVAEPGGLLTAVQGPLLRYVCVLLAGHLLVAAQSPLSYLAAARIDGRHRQELSRLVAGSATIGALERSEVQALIRTARADPESFMDGRPGEGALAQLALIGRFLGLASAGAVLAAWVWWAGPLLVLAGLAVHRLRWDEGRRRRDVWRHVPLPSMRADVFSDALVSPAEGKEVRIFGLGEWALTRVDREMRSAFDPIWPVERRTLVAKWQKFALMVLPLGIVYVAVAADAARGGVAVAIASAVLVAGSGVFGAFEDSGHLTINALTCLAAYAKVRTVLAAPAPAATTAVPSAEKPPLIRFEGVRFGYPDAPAVLDGLDLEIRPGELLGIVGVNGAGKSTLIKLLARLYEPDAGRITADGLDVSTMDVTRWRSGLSVVFQDFVRYHLPAADNVALGNALVPAEMAAVRGAAEDAGLDAVVGRLPAGWDTPLARTRTGGVDLSGGQWQQVALARALYAMRTGARVLILDEPTAHLDVRTESGVFARLAAHRGDASVVLISHRLATVRQADRIVLLDGGRITETGTHDELMAAGGRYAEMFTIQARRFRAGYDDRLDEGDL